MKRETKIHGSMLQYKVPHYLAEGVVETAKRLNVSAPDLLRYLLDFGLGFISDKDKNQVRQIVAQRQIDITHKQTEIDIKNRKHEEIESDLVTSFSVMQASR